MATSLTTTAGTNELDVDSLAIAGTSVTSTAAELNALDGVTATAADLNLASSLVGSITVVAANAAADTIDVVITALDPDGTAVTSPTMVAVWLTDLSTGVGGSVHTHSTGPAFTVGEEVAEHITNDSWTVLTTAAGTCTLRLVDTANEDVTINAAVGPIRGSDTTVAGDWSA